MLKEEVKAKKIKRIVHFTRIENVDSILEEGLRPREELEASGSTFAFNDEIRLDEHLDATCCSICYPNYKMFYKLRKENPGQEWAIIGIRPEILWKKEVAFCFDNAASSSIRDLSIDDLKGEEAFLKLFGDNDGHPMRDSLNLPDCYPTNPQSEILVFDRIDPDDIFGLVFESPVKKAVYKAQYPKLKILGNSKYFAPRRDWKHW